MPTFRNVSDKVFIDGNITVLPNQLWTVMDPARIDQLTSQYGWQFECVDEPSVTEAPETTEEAPETPFRTKPLSKMNRAELESEAAEIGLVVTEAHDTNSKLKTAIEHKQQEG